MRRSTTKLSLQFYKSSALSILPAANWEENMEKRQSGVNLLGLSPGVSMLLM
jgi:hypothetical protein